VIRNYAESGNVVLVGRAGFLLTRHIPRSLHVKLIAPLEWRTEKIAERMQISYQEARKKVNDMDQERNLFLNFFKYNPKDCDNFNLVFNRKDFSKHEIVEILLRIVEERKFY
jgi:cytidylate kinase